MERCGKRLDGCWVCNVGITYPSGERFGWQGKRRMRGCWGSGGWDFLDDHCVKVTVGCRAGCAAAARFCGVGSVVDAWSGWGLLVRQRSGLSIW